MIPSLAYNPGFLGRDAVIAQFVARERELSRVLEDIRALRFGHHVLVAGTRGMGKTTLLQRVEAEVVRDPALSSWLALKFPEEQYNVRTAADFWVNCLDAMADTFESSGRTDDARALDDAIAALPDDDDAREADALDLLATHAGGRHVLLLVDNLDLLAERVDGWKLRAVLSDPARDLTIVGATSGDALFTADYGKPFLDFFTVVPLDPLSFEEARDLLRKLAVRDSANALLELLEQDEGRFYGLFTLSGGNPRTLIQLYTVLSRSDAKQRDIEGDLEQLLDQVTPLYKAKFEQLPTQSQQVLDAVAIHWAPVLASSVAESMRMEVTQVSAQLSRLQKLGWIEKVELPDTARSGFQVAERFFNVWYLVRTSRRMRRKLMLLAECLVVLHGKDAVVGHARRALTDPSSRPELLLALSRCVDDASLSRALDLEALDRITASAGSPIATLAAEFDDAPWRDAVENKLHLKGVLRTLQGDHAAVGRLIASSPIPANERRRLLESLARNETPTRWFDAIWELARMTACYGDDAATALGAALANGDLLDLTDKAGASAVSHRSEIDLSRILMFESEDPADIERVTSTLLADASAGEMIAFAHRAGLRKDIVAEAFQRSSKAAATAWIMTFPAAFAPFPPEAALGHSVEEQFVLGRILVEAERFGEAAETFGKVAKKAGDPLGSLLRDQARLWQGVAASHSVDATQRELAKKILSATFWWPGAYDGPRPLPYVPSQTEWAALWKADFELVADVAVKIGGQRGALLLLMRLHLDDRSLAPYDHFLAASLEAPEDFVHMVLESVLLGNAVPVRLTDAIGDKGRPSAAVSLLLLVAERWEHATEIARQLDRRERIDTETAARVFDRALELGHAGRLATFLTSTPFGEYMMPYAAASAALADEDPGKLLAWPVEVQQPAREIVDRFAMVPSPSTRSRGSVTRPKKQRRKRS